MDEDENPRLWLSLLDATTERIFKACAEIMVAESSAIAVVCDTETIHQGTSNCLQQDVETRSQSNALPSASQDRSYCNQSRKRRKLSSTTDLHVLEEPSSATQINNTRAFVGWPQTFAFTSFDPGNPLKEFKAKNNFTFTKNFEQRQRNGAPRSNVGSSVNNLLGGATLPSVARFDSKYETESTEKFDDFTKEIHEAIDKIESLIPSLQKLVNGAETPINQQNAGKLELRNNFNSISEDDPVNRLGTSNVLEVTKKRMSHVSDSFRRSKSRGKSMSGASQRKITLHNQISEETSRSSRSTSRTSSGTSVQQSGYHSSLTGSYLSTDLYSSGSDETDGGYEKVRQSSREWSDSSQSNTDGYSDISPSSEGSSEWSHRREDHRVEMGKTVGRISKFRKKLGTIFHHHHHHHHHHYNDRDESDLGRVGLLKRITKFFHRSGKNDRKRVKAEKSQKPGNKSVVVKKKKVVRHFRTLVDGLMRHKTRHSKNSKKVKDDMEVPGSGPHKSKRTKKKLPWLPKMGRGKVKVPNKGKVKLNRIATKTARMILT